MKKENNEKGKELLRVKHKAVNYIQNPAGYNLEQLQHVLSDVAGHFKSVTGVSNNAAWLMCLDALDVLKKHPNYKGRVKYEFKRVYEAYRKYEHKLLYATAEYKRLGRGVVTIQHRHHDRPHQKYREK
jgi:hypothetical protein